MIILANRDNTAATKVFSSLSWALNKRIQGALYMFAMCYAHLHSLVDTEASKRCNLVNTFGAMCFSSFLCVFFLICFSQFNAYASTKQ